MAAKSDFTYKAIETVQTFIHLLYILALTPTRQSLLSHLGQLPNSICLTRSSSKQILTTYGNCLRHKPSEGCLLHYFVLH